MHYYLLSPFDYDTYEYVSPRQIVLRLSPLVPLLVLAIIISLLPVPSLDFSYNWVCYRYSATTIPPPTPSLIMHTSPCVRLYTLPSETWKAGFTLQGDDPKHQFTVYIDPRKAVHDE